MQVCTSLQADNHTSTPPLSFLQAGCPSYRPTNSVKALKALHVPSSEGKTGRLDAGEGRNKSNDKCGEGRAWEEKGDGKGVRVNKRMESEWEGKEEKGLIS